MLEPIGEGGIRPEDGYLSEQRIGRDVLHAMYYEVRSCFHEPHVVFLNDGHMLSETDCNVYWLVESDDANRHILEARYRGGKTDVGCKAIIDVEEENPLDPRLYVLTNSQVLRRWEFMKELLPEESEKFERYTDEIILRWYHMMTREVKSKPTLKKQL